MLLAMAGCGEDEVANTNPPAPMTLRVSPLSGRRRQPLTLAVNAPQ